MRRTYGRERFLDRVALIREHVPDCALTTDIIVGFPGETEADFARDARGRRGGRLRRRLHLHLLAAPRHRGGRVRRSDFVDHDVAVERMERLVEVVQRRARERAQRFVGRTLDVLVEGTSRHDPSRLRGRTTHNKVVNFDGLAVAGRDRRGRDQRRHEPDRSPAPSRCSREPLDIKTRHARCRRGPAITRPSAPYANICSCAGHHKRSSRTTRAASRAWGTRWSAASTLRRRWTSASTRSAPSRPSTASQPSHGSRSRGRSTRTADARHACVYCAGARHAGPAGRRPHAGDRRPPRRAIEIYGTEREGRYRRFVKTEVLAHWSTVKPAYRVTLEDGTELVASGDHRFLSRRGWKHVTGTEHGRRAAPHLTLERPPGRRRAGSPLRRSRTLTTAAATSAG